MRTINNRRDERGIALVMTIFGLLLLTAIAMTLMFSSDSETRIATNYRDKQAASYAAVSGIQEARDRLQPLFGDLSGFPPVNGIGPTQLATVGNGQVLYIINPRSGAAGKETVAPWKPTINGQPNPYFDKELCQERGLATRLGLAPGVLGVPCPLVAPAGNNWYSVYDDSANATNWKLADAAGNPIPLDYKWVRVTLKSDNDGPVYVQTPASAANGTQVCWDTRYDQQLQRPAAAGNNCLGANAGASVASVNLASGGAGYSLLAPPTVTFVGGGGNGAAATAQVAIIAGGINSASLGAAGSGYSSPPTVSIVGPDGTGAALAAVVTGTPITAVTVAGANYCYSPGTALGVNFTPNPSGTGSNAAANVVMTGQACISGFVASASCKSNKNSTLAITSVPGATGGGFSGSVTLDNKGVVSSVSISNVGNYTAVPGGSQVITVSGCAITAAFTGGIQIGNINLTSGGSYITAPSAVVTGANPSAPSATQPTLNAAWAAGPNNGKLSAIQVTAPGSGYAKPSYALTISGGGGSGATGTATSAATTTVTGLTLTSGGTGYISAPTVVIGGPGAGATATANLTTGQKLLLGQVYMLTSLAVTKSGSQAMVQMEAGVPPPQNVKFQLGGALTIAGPNPLFGTPNSQPFVINGTDANSCGEAAGVPLPAIGVANANAQNSIISALGKPQNYIGAQSSPDVQVDSGANPTPQALTQLVTDIQSEPGANVLPGPVTSLPATNKNSITVVNGDLTISGNPSGQGILVVTGNMTISGNFSWQGLILVIGSATMNNQGGGNGQITGAVYVGNSNGTTLGQANFNWSGGGGNGIQYDHCWADDLLNNLPPAPTQSPLQVLSTRTLEF